MNESQIWNEVDEATLPPSQYFGRVDIDMYYCVLVKGQGAVVFDANQHHERDKRRNMTISLTPLSSSKYQFVTERKVLAESKEWVKIILPSIKALGITTRELNGQWVRYEMVPDGRTYTDKNSGEEKHSTTFKFLSAYASEEEAEKAAAELYTRGDDGVEDKPEITSASNGNDAEKKVAASFLPSIVNMCNGDRGKISTMLANNQLLAKYFTVDSPEIQTLLMP